MDTIAAYKGIAPGKIIANRLAKEGYTQRKLAEMTGEHYQTLNAIISGKRWLPLELSLKLDRAFGFEEGFFAIIQTYYQIALSKHVKIQQKTPPSIRKTVFWDVDYDKLDWYKDKEYILARVRERGNKEELQQVKAFYDND